MHRIEDFIQFSYNMRTQVLVQNGMAILQAQDAASWRHKVGMDKVMTCRFMYDTSTLQVEIGAGKWANMMSAGAAGVAGLILYPIGVPLGLAEIAGAYITIPNDILKLIEYYFTHSVALPGMALGGEQEKLLVKGSLWKNMIYYPGLLYMTNYRLFFHCDTLILKNSLQWVANQMVSVFEKTFPKVITIRMADGTEHNLAFSHLKPVLRVLESYFT